MTMTSTAGNAPATSTGKWRLKGYDTFEGGADAYYSIPGEYDSREEAVEAAKKRLTELEETQPTESSGGQDSDGIQDQVYIVDPHGRMQRFTV